MSVIQKLCPHPASWLHVKRKETNRPFSQDFTEVTYHLYCRFCYADVDIKFARMNMSVEQFLNSTPMIDREGK